MSLKDLLVEKRCIMVCGGGGVGKTTVSASLAVAGARFRGRVLVLTIDPAKRLLQAFGFSDALLNEG
ncbi:MAG: ArsA family ATPase, partial [Proteobacteria bacterium]|nr:ArsA family ATPase [Pseudomonadota bacterium]